MNEKKILYVEDDLSLIEGLKYTLEKNGFLVDNARTVMEAYQFFQAGQYDLLRLDVTLPDGTGFDICKEVKQILCPVCRNRTRLRVRKDTELINFPLFSKCKQEMLINAKNFETTLNEIENRI